MSILALFLLAFFASLLTFYAGFGLSTILTPALMLLFPAEIAIMITGLVHISNNLFKFSLTRGSISYHILWRFGFPAFIASFVGSFFLKFLSHLSPLFSWEWQGISRSVYPHKFLLAVSLMLFTLIEWIPTRKKIDFNTRNQVLGGAVTGFFGGLTGMQGALRSAFLARSGIGKETLIGTSIAISTVIDFSRVGVYLTNFQNHITLELYPPIIGCTLAAFSGAWIGNKYLDKLTLPTIQTIIGIALITFSFLVGIGII